MRRTALSSLASGSPLSTTTYGYDNASRLASVSDGNSNSAAYTYLANSMLVSNIVLQQSSTTRMTTTKQYDYLNRLTQISSAPSASYTLPLTYNYNYNAANQRTQDKLADGSYWVYGYDSLGQVTNACKYFPDGTPVAGQQFDYAFDTIGNRTQTQAGGDSTGANLRTANYTNNTLNQITSRDVPSYVDVMGASILSNAVTVNGQTAYRKQEYYRQQLAANNSNSALWTNIIVAGGLNVTGNVYVAKTPEIFSYDADGNLTNDGRWIYTWDGENRLKGMTVNTNVGPQYQLTFAYDSKGRRIQKIVATNSVAYSTNNFLYDGWNLVSELNPNNSLIRSYVWGNDLSGSMQGAGGVGGLVEVSYYGSSTTNCFPAYDGNGNIVALINAADGTFAANYEYGPFGEVIRATGPMAKANPFRFSTKYDDDESDLLYYGYRYYKPSTGTWLNRDPNEEQGGLNLYNFVGNRPIYDVDPFGLMRWGDLLRIQEATDAAVRNQTCCCYQKAVILATISGTASGQQVTETVNLNTQGCVMGILQYYWWDCFTAQQEYNNDNSPNKPTGRQAWQDYGWHLGSNPQTQSHKGTPGWVPIDWNDGNNWNWQAAVLYMRCAGAHLRVDLKLSNAIEWTWLNGGWANPHNGNY